VDDANPQSQWTRHAGGRMKEEDCELEASEGYMAKTLSKKKKRRRKEKEKEGRKEGEKREKEREKGKERERER
jgi:hypothetical protein